MRQNAPDDFQTPPEALNPLIPFIPKEWIVWECAEGTGNLSKRFRELGYTVIGTDILTGYNFLNYQPLSYDCIVTNPLYSKKHQFLKRCYALKKPFALLLPLTALETKTRQLLYRKYGLQLILFSKRINFEVPKSLNSIGAWFATAWFTNGLSLPNDLNYVDSLHPNQTKLLPTISKG